MTMRWLALCGLVLSLFASNAQAQGIDWHKDYDAALKQAQETGQPLLVELSTSWCHFCRKMMRETLQESRVVGIINDGFVPVLLDADRHPSLVRQWGVSGYPTTVLVSPEGKMIQRLKGYKSASLFARQIASYGKEARPVVPEQELAFAVATTTERDLPPLAYSGYCPVELQETCLLESSTTMIELTHNGQRYRFLSKASALKFRANPDQYLPVAGGVDVVVQHHDGIARAGDADWAITYRDRIWLFCSAESQDAFCDDPAPYLQHLAD